MYHKFQNRETLEPVYFSEAGKEIFQKDAESEKYNYIGTVTEEEKAAEEAKSLEAPKVTFTKPKAKTQAGVVALTEEEEAKKEEELKAKNEKILEEEEAARIAEEEKAAEEKRKKDADDLKDSKGGAKK